MCETPPNDDECPTADASVLRQLTEYTDDALWMFTPDWEEVVFVNSAYEDIFGQSTDRLEENPTAFLDAVHPDDREAVREGMEALSDGNPTDVEFRVDPDNEYQTWVWVQGQPVYDEAGNFEYVAGYTRDVTDRKTDQQRLERHQAELERSNESLQEFASVVSHDLRNPLSVALGRVEYVQRRYDSDHLATAVRALERMDTLIDDLLALARQGKSVDDTAPVDLSALADECWHHVATPEAELTVETDLVIRADGNRLRQLFENLVRNAVEHGGDSVGVTIGALDGGGFYVEDDGTGIPSTERERVFESGYSSTGGGTGFGLMIVRQIVEAHGWELRVTEGTDGGARFEITGVDVVE
ncbi:MAG: PAS domain-containing sensor histidine kinase [Haloarculaceae archaeon]